MNIAVDCHIFILSFIHCIGIYTTFSTCFNVCGRTHSTSFQNIIAIDQLEFFEYSEREVASGVISADIQGIFRFLHSFITSSV
jgi:hypothetical protein